MILFFNVKITQLGKNKYHRNSWFPKDKRINVFKYSIASYACLKTLVNKAVFYIELAPEFTHEKESLENFILDLFPDALIYWYRNSKINQWKEACERDIFPFNDDVVWYCGNDDHIFIDYDLDVVSEGIKILENEKDQLASMYYSHWPEQCRMSKHLNGELTPSGNYLKFKWRTFDSIRAIKVASFKHYWFEQHDNRIKKADLWRTDVLTKFNIVSEGASVYCPTRELVRHYDGYSHLHKKIGPPGYLSNIIPPIIIPPGFFEKQMKVRIGFFERKEGWTTLNPLAKHLYAAHPSGVDYRWAEEDIPIFWRDRITELEISSNYEKKIMDMARDKSFISITRIPMNMYNIIFNDTDEIPEEIYYEKHLRYEKN